MERNLTAHEPHPPLPCLCSRCLPSAPPLASVDGLTFHRVEARGEGRVLHSWIPDELKEEEARVQAALERRLGLRFKSRYAVAAPGPAPEGIFSRFRRFLGI